MTTIYWLRNDLRLHDNECLQKAVNSKNNLLIVYCFDPRQFRKLELAFRKTGYLRFKFLMESLEDLRQRLKISGNNLLIKVGKPEKILPPLIKKYSSELVVFQKEIASEEVAVEEAVIDRLEKLNCTYEAIWGKTLYHIADGPFKPEDTPLTSKAFRINLTKKTEVRPLIPTPDKLPAPPDMSDWGAMPTPEKLGFTKKEITENSDLNFPGGETAALERLDYYSFKSEQLTSYRWTRNRSKGMEYSSKFSPWMALGCLSPRMIYWEVKRYEKEVKKNASSWWIIFEIVWRDFFKYQGIKFGDKMFYSGGIRDRKTDWKYDKDLFARWQWGKTGIPFVDAHMRQLNKTGFMSNRGRVNCASFLTRDYQIDWRWGAAWFETQLLDYDVCSNWINWNTQATEIWYTNPVHQGMKYDKTGEYVRDWLPELAKVPGPIIQAPWLLNAEERIEFGAGDYPLPEKVYKKWQRATNRIEKAYRIIASTEK